MAMLLGLTFLGCATLTKKHNLFDAYPDLVKMHYTPVEIQKTNNNFETNPSNYSQELGILILWQMYQKYSEFAMEFAQIPELNNGIDTKEAMAMASIYSLIKNLNIPPDLFEEKGQSEKYLQKIYIEWESNSGQKSEWKGSLNMPKIKKGRGYYGHNGMLYDAKPIGFEPEDEFDDVHLRDGVLFWKSLSKYQDRKSIIVTIEYPEGGELYFHMNNKPIKFNKAELFAKGQLYFTEGLDGTLIIRNAAVNLSSELLAIRDMVVGGSGDYKISPLMQALLWGYMDGTFKENDYPFKNYQDSLEFIKPIWGNMKGPRWNDFKEVTSRLNTPELVDYYTHHVFSYNSAGGDHEYDWPSYIFSTKSGNCLQCSSFIQYCLNKAGYKAHIYCVPTPHKFVGFKDKDNKWYVIDNGRRRPAGIKGPYNSEEDLMNIFSCNYYL
jgi:hypothetical protein